MMEKITKFQIFRFFLYGSFIVLATFVFWAKLGVFKQAWQSVLLAWSFFILCTPYPHGRIILGVPYKMITGRTMRYPEVLMWFLAVVLNIISYISIPFVYMLSLVNHMLYRVISTPWPYWGLVIVCAFGTFYKFFVGFDNFKARKLKHYPIRILFMILGFSTFLYFSYKEIIILMDIRA